MTAHRIKPHPGGFIVRNYIEALGLTRNELAEALGVHRTTLSKLLNGRAAMTADMAVRLSRVLGRSPESWLQMQVNHDLSVVEDTQRLSNWTPAKVLREQTDGFTLVRVGKGAAAKRSRKDAAAA